MQELDSLISKLKEEIKKRCIRLELADAHIKNILRGIYSKLYTSTTSKPTRGKKPSVAIRAYYAGKYINLKRTTREELFPVMKELTILYRVYRPLLEHKREISEWLK